MRRCDKSFAGRRWQVLCVIAVLFGSLLVGSIIHTALKAACTTRLTKSLITIKTSADSWSALESEAIHRESQSYQDKELSELKDEDFEDGIAMRTREGYISKYIWDYFQATNACPMKQKLGKERRTGDHGKWICGVKTLLQKPGCIVYSVGSNGLTEFEQDIVHMTPCEVHIFDPTLSLGTQQQLRQVKEFDFHDTGLIAEGVKGNVTAERRFPKLDMQPLSGIMANLGHTWIDVLKVDVEGWEWEVLDSWLTTWDVLPFTQLQVEFHYKRGSGDQAANDDMDQPSAKEMLGILQRMQQRGLRAFNIEPNYWWGNNAAECMEFAFVQVDSLGHMLTSRPQSS
ncbi:g9857 [Coccomyxa viridis]|uniref:G9857 protein n=1 Tax=Coccomyxa viridis TaxID=1274662 RepID=A0ABP1G5B5_9CHLO